VKQSTWKTSKVDFCSSYSATSIWREFPLSYSSWTFRAQYSGSPLV